MSKVLAIVILALIAYNVLSSTGLIKHTGILSSLTGGAGSVPVTHAPATGANPSAQGTLSNRNLFEAGHHAGLNTQLNSLRNGNQQLRSDPLIPRVSVGPWSQSTYEADTNRREFEIGGI